MIWGEFNIDKRSHRKVIYKRLLRSLKRDRRRAIRNNRNLSGCCYLLHNIMYDNQDSHWRYGIMQFYELGNLKHSRLFVTDFWWDITNPKYNKTRINELKYIIENM